VLLLVTCATIASCDDFDDIVAWGRHHLVSCGGFPIYHGIPCERWLQPRQPHRPAMFGAFRGLDRGALAAPARPHRHRRQDGAPHPRPRKGLKARIRSMPAMPLTLAQLSVPEKTNEITAIHLLDHSPRPNS
jgi:hypothetical protein